MSKHSLAQPSAAFAGDRGVADPILRDAIARVAGTVGYARAIVALCAARLLLPIVASGEDGGTAPDPDRHAEMAAISIEGANGERALLAFTGIDSLQAWNPKARPVPCTIDDLAATVAEAGASALLLDLAGPNQFTIEGDMLVALAAGQRLVELDDGTFGWLKSAELAQQDISTKLDH